MSVIVPGLNEGRFPKEPQSGFVMAILRMKRLNEGRFPKEPQFLPQLVMCQQLVRASMKGGSRKNRNIFYSPNIWHGVKQPQ